MLNGMTDRPVTLPAYYLEEQANIFNLYCYDSLVGGQLVGAFIVVFVFLVEKDEGPFYLLLSHPLLLVLIHYPLNFSI